MSPPREPVRYPVPADARVGACRGCAAAIAWITTPAGKAMPVDPDGTPHWATCPKAKDFKRR